MGISLYDLSVKSYLQMLGSTADVLAKGKSFLADNNIDSSEALTMRLHENMYPLSFQLNSVRHHSLGCIEGIQNGIFEPPPPLPTMSYEAFQQFIADTKAALIAFSENDINALTDKPLLFKLGKTEIPFIAENFVMSFSLPNFYFHVTTTYDILRANGVPLGKQDYMGNMRIGH